MTVTWNEKAIMQQLHEGLHILPPQYSPAEPWAKIKLQKIVRLATVDVDFACYKQTEMQIKGNFPFSLGQRTWHSTGKTDYGLTYMAYLT